MRRDPFSLTLARWGCLSDEETEALGGLGTGLGSATHEQGSSLCQLLAPPGEGQSCLDSGTIPTQHVGPR